MELTGIAASAIASNAIGANAPVNAVTLPITPAGETSVNRLAVNSPSSSTPKPESARPPPLSHATRRSEVPGAR